MPGGIAQLVEHLLCKQGVRSSNLLISTKQKFRLSGRIFCFVEMALHSQCLSSNPRCFAAAPRGMPSPLRFAGCLPVVASLLPHGTRLKAPRPSGPRTEFLRRADALCPVHVEPLWCTNGPSNRISYTKSTSGVQTARQPATKWGVFVAGRCLMLVGHA